MLLLSVKLGDINELLCTVKLGDIMSYYALIMKILPKMHQHPQFPLEDYVCDVKQRKICNNSQR
jgi:hypothetical protein